MTFILASNNAKKLIELRDILSELGLEVISQREAGIELEVDETGTTFAENAYLKAKAACEVSGKPAIADDSGLVVEALGGAPGVYSARYGSETGAKLDDRGRNALLLKNMEGISDRRAKFVSSIACVFPDGRVIRAEGECCGEIMHEEKGDGGFGYDPLFLLPEFGKSMAEVTAEEKNSVSHRGRALRQFREKLKDELK